MAGGIILERNVPDASELGIIGWRALGISRNGKLIAAVTGKKGTPEEACILGAPGLSDIPLEAFAEFIFGGGPEVIDQRGASYSHSDLFLAIRERPNVVGFWQAADGNFLGRITLQPPSRGSVFEDADGISSNWFAAASDDNLGWFVEAEV